MRLFGLSVAHFSTHDERFAHIETSIRQSFRGFHKKTRRVITCHQVADGDLQQLHVHTPINSHASRHCPTRRSIVHRSALGHCKNSLYERRTLFRRCFSNLRAISFFLFLLLSVFFFDDTMTKTAKQGQGTPRGDKNTS